MFSVRNTIVPFSLLSKVNGGGLDVNLCYYIRTSPRSGRPCIRRGFMSTTPSPLGPSEPGTSTLFILYVYPCFSSVVFHHRLTHYLCIPANLWLSLNRNPFGVTHELDSFCLSVSEPVHNRNLLTYVYAEDVSVPKSLLPLLPIHIGPTVKVADDPSFHNLLSQRRNASYVTFFKSSRVVTRL